MSELKPCPLCGAMPEKLRTGYMCSTLGCALQENTVSAKEWNTRPIEDALTSRIANLEGANRGLGANYIYELNENIKLNARIAELEAESERFTVHSDIERQDDKSPNDTQTQTIVYGKERE